MRWGWLAILVGCADELDQRLAILTEPRVLAVVATPAEALPGEEVSYRALVGGPDGELTGAVDFQYCTTPKPPTEDNSASVDCVAGTALAPVGTIPADACQTFGPDTVKDGFRPRDPDPSGGYYQPVHVVGDGLLAIALSRVTCDLANAPGDVSIDYKQHYVANANPVLHAVVLPALHAGGDVTLSASWDEPETFIYYDQLGQTLITRREAMRLSVFATAGSTDVDAIAVAEDDPATSGSITWHVPAAGPQTLFFVLCDERGGIDTRTIAVDVLP